MDTRLLPFKTSVSHSVGVVTITVRGECERDDCCHLEALLSEVTEPDPACVLLDLSDVPDQCAEAAVGFIGSLRQALPTRCVLIVGRPSPTVRCVLAEARWPDVALAER